MAAECCVFLLSLRVQKLCESDEAKLEASLRLDGMYIHRTQSDGNCLFRFVCLN
jgi:hypothetical protein